MKYQASGDRLNIASQTEGVWEWDMISDRRRLILPRDRLSIDTVALSPDGRWAAVASQNDSVRVWDTVTGGSSLA